MLADREERAARLRKAIFDIAKHKSFKAACEGRSFKEAALTHHANNTRPFDLETGYQYAKAFKVDPAWLLGIVHEPGAPVEPDLSDEALTGLLAAALKMPAPADMSDRLAENVAQSLRGILRFVSTDPAMRSNPVMIEGAVRSAIAQALEERPPA